ESARGGRLFDVSIRYVVHGSGDVRLDCRVQPTMAAPPRCLSLARVGLHLQAAPGLSQVAFFGRGPHENYWDRKHGAHIGVYRAAAADMQELYIHPTESGGRTDVRWMALTADNNSAVAAGDGKPFQANVSYYDVSEVEAAERYIDLPKRDAAAHGAHVFVDHRHMGVGGDNTWLPDAVHDEFLVRPQAETFSVWMAPL
ncbi:unnamed protein product, partial [Phaeothamnion confervicola]